MPAKTLAHNMLFLSDISTSTHSVYSVLMHTDIPESHRMPLERPEFQNEHYIVWNIRLNLRASCAITIDTCSLANIQLTVCVGVGLCVNKVY